MKIPSEAPQITNRDNPAGIKPPALSALILKPRAIITAMIALFFIFGGLAFFLGYQHIESSTEKALASDKISSNLLATLLLEHQRSAIGLLRSYAARPSFIDAVRRKDVPGARWHLGELKKHHEIDLTFVTDPKGVLWVNYPYFPEAVGKDLSYRDWYKGVSSKWQPYISEVFKLIVADKPMAVAISVPVVDSNGKVVGILSNSHRLDFLVNTIKIVPFSPHTTATIIDRTGDILYSNKYSYKEKETRYPNYPLLEQALKSNQQKIKTSLPGNGGKLYMSISSVGQTGWTVIIERKGHDVFREELGSLVEIG